MTDVNEPTTRMTLESILACLHVKDRAWLQARLNSQQTEASFEKTLTSTIEEDHRLSLLLETHPSLNPWVEYCSPISNKPEPVKQVIRKKLLELSEP